MPSFDQSTWLAYRVQSSRRMGVAEPPKMVALPAAKAAISHDHLLAHQSLGRREVDVVVRVNEKWQQEGAQRLSEHASWVSGPYTAAIVEMRKRAAEKAAEELRRRAMFEQILKEREGDSGDT